MKRQILVNKIITPDGTELISNHVHDFVMYKDKNGKSYAVDGGSEYLRRIGDIEDCKEASLYSDSPFKEIRKYFKRGGRGKDGKQPLKWVVLKDMSTSWVMAVIEYEDKLRPDNPYTYLFVKELEYRIEDEK